MNDYLNRSKAGFRERMEKQCLPIHKVAFILHPPNHTKWSQFSTINKQQVTDFLVNYGGYDVVDQFYQYLDEVEAFHTSRKLWEESISTKLFWRIAVSQELEKNNIN